MRFQPGILPGFYRVASVDPPWQFEDDLPGETRGAAKQYPTMPVEDICRFEIPPMAATSWLFLWRVACMVEEAYHVARAWGFEPKSEIVWRKLTKHGKLWIGMGRTVRASHETCIVATRGGAKPIDLGVRSVFDAPVPVDAQGRYIHSAKPECFYTDIVQRLAPGPYVELFARRRRPGWDAIGNQLPEAVA